MTTRASAASGGTAAVHLDSPLRFDEIRATLARKPSLRRFYERNYRRYAECLERCPSVGLALELGSGGGFARTLLPALVTSDIIPYPGLQLVLDGTRLPFATETLRFIGMSNVFHHIPDVEAFLTEAQRCLKPGGRLLVVDQHLGYISRPILRYLHHEPFDPDSRDWRFRSSGPLSGANGALSWIVFVRDRQRYTRLFPRLALASYSTHTPVSYWLAGGLKRWNLLPRLGIGPAEAIERVLLRCSAGFGSFADAELVKS